MIPREKQARIVEDLARGHRSPLQIAERHHVTTSHVLDLRDEHGPDLGKLTAAAERLRRPAPVVPAAPDVQQPDPAPAPVAGRGPQSDQLTTEERAACREWARRAGLEVAYQGRVARDVIEAWDAAGRPTPAVVDAEPVEESDDDGVVDVPVVEDAGGVSWPAYIAMETPEASRILAAAKVALTDVADILPWAVEHCPDAVWDWVGKSAELTDTVAVERIEQDRVQAAAQVLYELALQGLLQPTPDALHRAAQLALAAAEAA